MLLLSRQSSGGPVFQIRLKAIPHMAHRDLASRIHFRNVAESGQTRIDANDPELTSAAACCCNADPLII